jgi:hypothetical protein
MRVYALSWAIYQQAEEQLAEAMENRDRLRAVMQEKWRECIQLPSGAYEVDGQQIVVKNSADYPPVLKIQ